MKRLYKRNQRRVLKGKSKLKAIIFMILRKLLVGILLDNFPELDDVIEWWEKFKDKFK